MVYLIFGGVFFVFWAFIVIQTYYATNTSHLSLISLNTEKNTAGQYLNQIDGAIYDAMIGYFFAILVIYLLYKTISLFFQAKKVSLNFWYILGFILLQILIISFFYTGLQGTIYGTNEFSGGGLTLFLHILQLLLYPLFLMLLWRGTGFRILSFFSCWEKYSLRFKIPVEISLGMGIFTTGLLILGAIGFYTLTGLIVLCLILLALSWQGWVQSWRDIQESRIEFDQHNFKNSSLIETIQPKLLSAEFAFIIVSMVFAIALISILRPMPIGWDDLGVYMNYPKIMAHNGNYLAGAAMFAWQLITGTGFLFANTASQAFFVNQIGGFLSVIVITAFLSLLLEQKGRKYFICLPILLATVYYIMPMTVFQQAKDMKLDPALMFMSVTAMMTLWYGLKALIKKEDTRAGLSLIGIAGVLVGFAFGIKFTTLLLIVAGLGYIGYRTLGIFGFIGFWGLFIAIFTAGNLWSRMFIWLPTENTTLIQMITIGSAGIGLIGLLLGISLHKKNTFPWLRGTIIFILGIGVSLLPWLIKNGSEAQVWKPGSHIISGLLSGSGGIFEYSYSHIYSPEEIKIHKEKAKEFSAITEDGKSNNEDFSRYFGQEEGLNNYIKLPTNLTVQKNQKGEFTDITYIFLLLVPIAGIFVRARKGFQGVWVGCIFLFTALLYGLLKEPGFVKFISPILSGITLPNGYLVLLIGAFTWQIIVHLLVDNSHTMSRRYKYMSFFAMTYALLFLVSAFGIVWYGVLVYFMFFVLISLGFSEAISSTEHDNEASRFIKGSIAGVLFVSLGIYLSYSAPQHNWRNLSMAGYNEYKYRLLSQEEVIFRYRWEYLDSIATVNLKDPKSAIAKSIQAFTLKDLQKRLPKPESLTPFEYQKILIGFNDAIKQNYFKGENQRVADDLKKAKEVFYNTILYPTKEEANTKGIYRIGTFMTYFIDNNRERYLDDNLITQFESYFYDEDPETTIDRMKKLGIGYLLVDLNAATIDRDPRHSLTRRFDHLLLSMRSKKLKLIDTDSICLRFAIDENKAGSFRSADDFLMIAGNNYIGYKSNGNPISPSQKIQACINNIYQKINLTSPEKLPTYLQGYAKQIAAAKGDKAKIAQILQPKRSYFVLFEIQ
ncbi:hypothetical protein CSB09_01555 [Candidatus Gracilibacteria bacterium]|nr:MAG: hypothetical protein CSB09_01555 [Candidatus Gracilibacteria bacterium]